MKYLFTAFCIFLLCGIASAGTITVGQPAAAATGEGATCDGYLLCQNFEGTGYDNSETWYEYISGGGGSIDVDSTSSPLRGSQSAVLYGGTSGNLTAINKYITESASGSVHVIYSTAGAPSYNGAAILALRDTGGNDKISIQLDTTMHARIEHQGVYTDYGAAAISNGDHLWLDWANGTGANGTASLYVSANGTKPGSAYVSMTNGANQTAIDRVFLWAVAGQTNTFDFVLEKSTTIGSVVP